MTFADSAGHQPDEPTSASGEFGAFPYRTAAAFRTALKDRFARSRRTAPVTRSTSSSDSSPTTAS